MGDKIVVMNNAVVEQFGTPQEVYDKPATMFVADFIGSPPMNFLHFEGKLAQGAQSIDLNGQNIHVPQLREGADGALAFGVRPEHVRLTSDGGMRAEVIATEYLGTTQIVTLETSSGDLKARIPSDQIAQVGEQVGLTFAGETVTLFETSTGRALISELNEGVLPNG